MSQKYNTNFYNSSPFDDDDDDYMFSSNKKTTTTNLTSTTYSNPFSLSSSVPSAVPPSSTASVTLVVTKTILVSKYPMLKLTLKIQNQALIQLLKMHKMHSIRMFHQQFHQSETPKMILPLRQPILRLI